MRVLVSNVCSAFQQFAVPFLVDRTPPLSERCDACKSERERERDRRDGREKTVKNMETNFMCSFYEEMIMIVFLAQATNI